MAWDVPFLTLLILVPFVGVLVTLLATRTAREARAVALFYSLVELGIALVLALAFLGVFGDLFATRPEGPYLFTERYEWVPQLQINYILGVDGLSLPLVVLTPLLISMAILFSWHKEHRAKEFFALLLLNELSIIGVFIALDFFLFFIFWELVLIPMFFLIDVWGGPRKRYSAIKFLIYTHVGSVIMLLGIFALYFYATPDLVGFRTFDMIAIGEGARINPQYLGLAFQVPVFIAFFFGFGVKMPMVPFHTWLPDAHVEAPTAGSVILAGLLLKMGGYGIFRVAFGMLPNAAVDLWWVVAVFGIVSMVYAAVVCLAQTDFKRLVAYSSVSHMGFVLLGAASLTSIGISGGIFQMFNHGLITAVLFMLAGVLKASAHTRMIPDLRGLGARMPGFAFVLIVGFMASLGLPGLNGFVSEFMVFVGAFDVLYGLILIPLLTVIVTGAYYLWTMHKMLMGDYNEELGEVRDLNGVERLSLGVLTALIILIGILPFLILQGFVNPAATDLTTLLQGVT